MTTATQMTPEISKTASLEQARSEVNMYRSGNGWIVSTYDAERGAWWQGRERPYHQAQSRRARCVASRAIREMYPGLECVEVAVPRDGSARERLDVAIDRVESHPERYQPVIS